MVVVVVVYLVKKNRGDCVTRNWRGDKKWHPQKYYDNIYIDNQVKKYLYYLIVVYYVYICIYKVVQLQRYVSLCVCVKVKSFERGGVQSVDINEESLLHILLTQHKQNASPISLHHKNPEKMNSKKKN